MKHARHAKKKKMNVRKLVITIFALLLLVSLVYIMVVYFTSHKEQAETDRLLSSVKIDSNSTEPEEVQRLKKLQEQYPDIVAWIEIDDTKINYPVMQTTDNEFYITHDYKKEEAIRGSLFLDKDYNCSIPSSNLLIYGHNNKDGSMFNHLLKYEKEEFYKEHPTIKFTTNLENANYEIIAVFLSRVYYKSEKDVFRYYQFINAENEEEYNNYVENAKKASLYDTGKTAQYGDQLLTLSTCEYSQKDGRFVVVAKKIQ